jgi:hypothetical protein
VRAERSARRVRARNKTPAQHVSSDDAWMRSDPLVRSCARAVVCSHTRRTASRRTDDDALLFGCSRGALMDPPLDGHTACCAQCLPGAAIHAARRHDRLRARITGAAGPRNSASLCRRQQIKQPAAYRTPCVCAAQCHERSRRGTGEKRYVRVPGDGRENLALGSTSAV